jgi:hypothetical protein
VKSLYSPVCHVIFIIGKGVGANVSFNVGEDVGFDVDSDVGSDVGCNEYGDIGVDAGWDMGGNIGNSGDGFGVAYVKVVVGATEDGIGDSVGNDVVCNIGDEVDDDDEGDDVLCDPGRDVSDDVGGDVVGNVGRDKGSDEDGDLGCKVGCDAGGGMPNEDTCEGFDVVYAELRVNVWTKVGVKVDSIKSVEVGVKISSDLGFFDGYNEESSSGCSDGDLGFRGVISEGKRVEVFRFFNNSSESLGP